MSRRVRDKSLDTREQRLKLKPTDKPYWRTVERTAHLGYRRLKSTAGTWCARFYKGEDHGTGKRGYVVERLGPADDYSDADGVLILSYWQAQQMVRDRAVKRAHAAAGKGEPATVASVMEDYLQHLEDDGKNTLDAIARTNAFILPKLGHIQIAVLTADDVSKFRTELAKMPARKRTAKGEAQRHHDVPTDDEAVRRRRNSANRVLSVLKAALSRAYNAGQVPSDAPWRTVKPFRGASAARIRYLTVDEARRLVNACEPDFRNIVQAALMSGLRYGELCRLEVADFNPDVGTLTVRKSKSAKARHVALNSEGQRFFASLCAGRSGNELMLVKKNGGAWGTAHQLRPMNEAVARAGIKPTITFHGLRHTWALLSIMAGMPLMVVAKNLGHRDTRMVELHYGHLAPGFVADEVRAKAPRYGIKPKNVAPIR
jgi:integrase